MLTTAHQDSSGQEDLWLPILLRTSWLLARCPNCKGFLLLPAGFILEWPAGCCYDQPTERDWQVIHLLIRVDVASKWCGILLPGRFVFILHFTQLRGLVTHFRISCSVFPFELQPKIPLICSLAHPSLGAFSSSFSPSCIPSDSLSVEGLIWVYLPGHWVLLSHLGPCGIYKDDKGTHAMRCIVDVDLESISGNEANLRVFRGSGMKERWERLRLLIA